MSVEKEILNGILSVIEKISNVQFQQIAWIEKKVHPYAFFEELMHNLFDDYELSEILNNYKIYGISKEQYNILFKFYLILDRFSNDKMSWFESVDPIEILKDPRWNEIQTVAKKVLKAFHYEKKSQ